ncbi:biotin carboxylase N-terminal domain-containing protein [Pseudarthrobacter sp. PS3-L1]|uniref:ATP-binding protein n=1 Tax=Pseudarthrobacter sp. PS3-L1 TaxID=3046207 RepID=UPI0024B9CE09|nr:biotin carboxylase N-terminal domain-containing protein [Pseudarthrobacter sp. PS3-L1]MDJ0322129.1 biotin carboxylase N-terminal domain-containing protein [Pseudarthrobacter sp. PS3-L1]
MTQTSKLATVRPTGGLPLFRTVLVANRGEIACRVIRSLRELGIESVAVYSDADAGARHVQEADRAVRLGPAPAAQSYLSIEAVLQACRETGAEAVHPGYGFLSENVEFARALEEAGVVFIGPDVKSLTVMGDKIRAKNHVSGYGVPVVPGIAEAGMSDDALAGAAASVGYPLLIKPSAGGGGKGMLAVEDPEELPGALAMARRVARSAFGDDTLFLERLVRNPRHIEVQILADTYGHVIHLGERECSLQRRHQKVIEEAPSPLLEGLDDGASVRERLGEAACQAARSVNYQGAGTVEFLVSDDAPDEFFFMEMNTRLQVEHPVTEMVTGLDLVSWQVRIAAGHALEIQQSEVTLAGHAVEARVYAERPAQNFLPAAGTILATGEPFRQDDPTAATSTGTAHGRLRIDSALVPGLVVTADYDPMVAKVISWGTDRQAALAGLDAALADFAVLGVPTNVEYLRLLLADPDVQAGRLDTGLIERRMPTFSFRSVGRAEVVAAALISQRHTAIERDGRTKHQDHAGGWNRRDGWRLGGREPNRIRLGLPDGSVSMVQLRESPGHGGTEVSVDAGPWLQAGLGWEAGSTAAVISSEGSSSTYAVAVDPHPQAGSQATLFLGNAGWSCQVDMLTRSEYLARSLAALHHEDAAADPEVRSPMPGTVVSLGVAEGDVVSVGTVLLAVEAMKMEHQLVAQVAGTVHLTVQAGDTVAARQLVAIITPQDSTQGTPQHGQREPDHIPSTGKGATS